MLKSLRFKIFLHTIIFLGVCASSLAQEGNNQKVLVESLLEPLMFRVDR